MVSSLGLDLAGDTSEEAAQAHVGRGGCLWGRAGHGRGSGRPARGFPRLVPTALCVREKGQVERDVPHRGTSTTVSEAIGETHISSDLS